MKSWKTTLAGILTLIGLGAKIYLHGFDGMTDLPAITAGIGLIAAKDHDVTGGTRQ